MHYTISKKEIRQAVHVLKACLHHPDADDAIAMLQGLLDQPEGEPVAWQIKFKDEHGTQRNVTYTHNAIGDYRQIDPDAICEPLYTHPAPFIPITADMVTDEMVAAYGANFNSWDTPTYSEQIEAAVNAYMGSKK
jgi:hypothetical protein